MASVLQVATIKDQGGNANAIEIANSSANVTINNLAGGAIGSAVTGFAGIKNAQEWRLTANFTSVADNVSMQNNWAQRNGSIGTALTYGNVSGTNKFGFPETGIWSIDIQLNGTVGTAGSYFQVIIYHTSDNATYNKYSLCTLYFDDATQADGSLFFLRTTLLLDVTDISNQFFKIHGSSNTTTATVQSDSSATQNSGTVMTVIRLGDT